jgi:hypothetical protein
MERRPFDLCLALLHSRAQWSINDATVPRHAHTTPTSATRTFQLKICRLPFSLSSPTDLQRRVCLNTACVAALFFVSAYLLLAFRLDGYTSCLVSRAFCRFRQVWLHVFSVYLTFCAFASFLPSFRPSSPCTSVITHSHHFSQLFDMAFGPSSLGLCSPLLGRAPSAGIFPRRSKRARTHHSVYPRAI